MFISSDNFKPKQKKPAKWQDSWVTYAVFIGLVWVLNFNIVIRLGS